MAALFFFGAIIGVVFAHFPLIVKYPDVDQLSLDAFIKKYPDVAWSMRLLKSVPLIWFAIFVFLFVSVPPLFHNAGATLFLLTFWFIGGIGFIDAIFEVITYISPHRYVSTSRTGGKGTSVERVALGDSVGKYGWIRIGLMIIIGVIIPVGIDLLSKAN